MLKKYAEMHSGQLLPKQFVIMNNQNKTRRLKQLLMIAVLFFSALNATAQELVRKLSGTVKTEKGELLSGVTIEVKDPATKKVLYTQTTGDQGSYNFTGLDADKKYDISFSYIGYEEVTMSNVDGGAISKPLNVQLKEKTDAMNEVVVTALGIKREQKALGYAAQTLDESTVNDARSNNWAGSLSGKVAGLSIISPGSGPLNSTRISLRGDNSMNADGNNALIVLDGVPMNSGSQSSGVNNAYGAGSGNDVPVDFGNGISDINPDDIETITVLKGPGATALYGSRAANGAILITTKSGAKKDRGLGVTFNSNVTVSDVLRWPDWQYEYGQGTGKALNANGEKYYSYGASADGPSTGGTSSAFGPKFDGQSYFQYDPEVLGQSPVRKPWVPYRNNVKGFFRPGYTLTNSLSLEGGNENGSARASITHSKNEWIMPNTGYERINAALSTSFKASDRIRINAKVNYTNKQSDNLPATGYNNQSISYFMIFQNPNVDLNWYRPIWKPGLEQIDQIHPFSSFIDNPYLIAYEMTNAVNNNAVVGNVSGNFQINKHFDLLVRSAVNLSYEERKMQRPYSSANFQKGYYKEQNVFFYEVNTDALLSYKTNIGKNFKTTASIGGNKMSRRLNRMDAYVEGLVIPGVYKLSNGVANPTTVVIDGNKNVHSLYGTGSISYQDKIFVDVTGRNDWSSTLPVQNNSFFYSSLNTSFILSELVSLPQQISFAKLRMSVAQVGNDTDPYLTSKYYGTSEFPASGSVPTTLHNIDFKPEISTSYEAGLDLRLFRNRVSIDAAVYRNYTKNQILRVPLDPTTGYNNAIMNAGLVRNEGIELVLSGYPVKTKNFSWNTSIVWSMNKNRVMELAEGMDDQQEIAVGGNAYIIAKVGGSTGAIYGFGFERSPDGRIIYNANGLPARPQAIQYIGEAYADWKGGLRNEFSYKNFRVNFLIDGQYGGIVYSQSHHKMTEQGKLKHTLRGREENFIIGDGVVLDAATGKYVENTKKVLPVDYYADYYRRANVESNSFDASFIKLREARIEYSLPKKVLAKTLFKDASFALYGRNLAMITSFPMFDPETAALNGSSIMPGIEMGQMPTERSYGANLTVKF